MKNPRLPQAYMTYARHDGLSDKRLIPGFLTRTYAIMTEPLALKIPSRKTQRLQTSCQQNASIADHQSIGQCNEASDDNMMEYSECLDMMRHQIIMLQKRKAPVNIRSVDNP